MNEWEKLMYAARLLHGIADDGQLPSRDALLVARAADDLLEATRTLRERYDKLQQDYAKCFCMLENATADWSQEDIEALGRLNVERPIVEAGDAD